LIALIAKTRALRARRTTEDRRQKARMRP